MQARMQRDRPVWVRAEKAVDTVQKICGCAVSTEKASRNLRRSFAPHGGANFE